MDEGLDLTEMIEGLNSIDDGAELSLVKDKEEENSVVKKAAIDIIRKFFIVTEVSSLDIINNTPDWN